MIILWNRTSDEFMNASATLWVRGDELIVMSESDAEALIEGLPQCPWTNEPEQQERMDQAWKWLTQRGYEEVTEELRFPVPLKNWPPPPNNQKVIDLTINVFDY